MKRIYPALILLILLISCNNSDPKKASIYNFIPEEASIIVTVNDIENLETTINNNAFINSISNASVYKNVSRKLNHLNYINTENPVVISFLKDKNDSLQFTITTKQISNLFIGDSLPDHKIETLQIANRATKKITFNNEVLYATFKDSIAVAASNSELLEGVLNNKHNKARQKIINTINNEKPVSLILSNTNNNLTHSFFNQETLLFKDFSDYTSIDAVISQDEILLNGITKAADSSKKLINVFKNTIPQENELAKLAPNNCDGFLSFTFNNFKTFKANLDTFNKKQDSVTVTSLFDNIIELGTIYFEENQAIVLNSIDVIATKDNLLSEQNKVEIFRRIPIYNFSKPGLFDTVFYPLVNYNEVKYYCVINQFFVFAKDTETLENIIVNYLNKTTLSSRNYYKNITKDLSNESSILQVFNNNKLKDLLDLNLDANLKNSYFKDYKISALQFVYDTHYAHLHAAIKKAKVKIEANAVTELLNIKLDADLLNNPQFVTNHRSKQKEIVVQDINNKLYLISNAGNILWRKQLNGPILGEIKQIDVYKNGKLQLVFATPNRIYLLDRKGRDVTGYPLKFNDEITQPLSVFDYDKRKDYRLFVTQGRNVLLYNAKGETVKGFKFSKAKNVINHQPLHIRIDNKDYILIKTDKKLNILSRRGETRVKLASNLEFSNAPVFNYNKTFTTSTKDGKIVSIDQKGKVSTKTYNLTKKHNLATTTKTLASQNENILNIKSKTLELDLGNYTPVKIFYINDKIYISVTDLQSQKVLLFDSKAKSIKNFPVYGNSTIALDNIDRDKSLELITKGDSNSILLYEIN